MHASLLIVDELDYLGIGGSESAVPARGQALPAGEVDYSDDQRARRAMRRRVWRQCDGTLIRMAARSYCLKDLALDEDGDGIIARSGERALAQLTEYHWRKRRETIDGNVMNYIVANTHDLSLMLQRPSAQSISEYGRQVAKT